MAGWNVGSPDTAYDSVSFSVSGQESAPHFVRWKPDGTKCYAGGPDTDRVYQYSASTPWDVSTLSYDSKSFLFIGQDSDCREIFWNPDGSQLFMLGGFWNAWFAYDAGTAWDVSTLTYNTFFNATLGAGEGVASFAFKSDGTKVFALDLPDKIRSYTLSTPWDVTSASYDGDGSRFTITVDSLLRALAVKPDGKRLFYLGSGGDNVYQHDLATGWDLSTIGGLDAAFSVGTQESTSRGMCFKEDGSKLYVVGTANDTIYQYTVGGAGMGLVVGWMTLA